MIVRLLDLHPNAYFAVMGAIVSGMKASIQQAVPNASTDGKVTLSSGTVANRSVM